MPFTLSVSGWPAVATACVAFAISFYTARSWPALVGAAIAAPFCFHVTRYPLFYWVGHIAIVSNVASAYAIHRDRRDIAFAALLPLTIVVGVLAVFAVRGITLMPADGYR